MNTLDCLAGLAVVMMSFGAHALDRFEGDEPSSGEETVTIDSLAIEPMAHESMAMETAITEPEVGVELDVPEYSPTQILCVRQRREGSRVKETKCQTLADWKSEIEIKNMRATSMLRTPGKSASWEMTP